MCSCILQSVTEDEGSCLEVPPPESQPAMRTAPAEITADSRLQDIQAVMGDAGLATIHTRGLGTNPFGTGRMYTAIRVLLLRSCGMAIWHP